MLTSQDLHFFNTVAMAISLADAARQLEVTAPAVSQRLRLLKERLGVRLVERGRGGIQLTPEGELLEARAGDILADISDLCVDVSARQDQVRGPLRVIAPFGFGRAHIADIMARFGASYPEVSLDLMLSDSPYTASRHRHWDVLIHIGRLTDSGSVQRRLASNRRMLCASPDYIARCGRPGTPGELVDHHCGVIRENDDDVALWNFCSEDRRDLHHRVRADFSSNDGEVVKKWALFGYGIIERSEWDVAAELVSGRLVEILPDYRMPDADVVALVSSRTFGLHAHNGFLICCWIVSHHRPGVDVPRETLSTSANGFAVEQPVDECGKVIKYLSRICWRIQFRVSGQGSFTLAGAHQCGPTAGRIAGLEVSQAVTDHPAPFQTIQFQSLTNLFQHTWQGLATIASIFGDMRAIDHMIDMPASRVDQLQHSVMHRSQR